MARLIDADELKNVLKVRHEQCEGQYGSLQGAVNGFIKLLDRQPTVDAEPVRRGKWILERKPDGTPYCFHCSVCDDDFHNIGIEVAYDYCPNCGAKMEGVIDNG